ncbi:hypothetical protein [Oceanobacillus sojae]|uniref:hypothetical protein n=1 Tax=Oceanobacillus sojae TaxID=582851 RepID=UPI0036348BC1
MMEIAGVTNPTAESGGFVKWFRIIGCIYILGNILGIFAIRSKSIVLWWIILIVNFTQGLGFAMIPTSMWRVVLDSYGLWGILPSAITDGGAFILSIVMIFYMIKYHSIWGQQRMAS